MTSIIGFINFYFRNPRDKYQNLCLIVTDPCRMIQAVTEASKNTGRVK